LYLLGLHIIDWSIIALYLLALIWIGRWTQKRVKTTKDFFQADRSFGRTMMSFLNFGNMVSGDQAAGVTSEIYRQGLSGVWFQNLVLFLTPFWWFSSVLQRRARYMAPGDIYEHRFESKFLSGLFAVYLLINAIYGSSIGYLITGKTMQAVMAKPAAAYTMEERESVESFKYMRLLEARVEREKLPDSLQTKLNVLHERSKRGEVSSVVSYLNLATFYILYGLITAGYVMMGGLFAAAFTDVLQGLMILFLSVILIPVGLSYVGGFSGLHLSVDDAKFQLFGTGAASEYTWYFVVVMALTNLIALPPRQFTVGGAAKDDKSARMGMVTGAFAKRFVIIGWALTGMLALAIFKGDDLISDPTLIWGIMTKKLLGVGFVGLMVASVLAANMASKAGSSLEWSAAFTRNILVPLRPTTSEKMQIRAGRLVILIVLMGGIAFAYVVDDIATVFRYVLSIGTISGPAIWLVYFWRRLTTRAVVIQMVLSILITVVVPNTVPLIKSLRESPALTIQTERRHESSIVHAKQEDVAAGAAQEVGQQITHTTVEEPTGVYFLTVRAKNPSDPASIKEGSGIFRFQLWLIGLFGVDLASFSKSGLSTLSFIFDILFPFIILFIVSLLTKPNSEPVLRQFYARVHTASHSDQEIDNAEVRKKIENPDLIEQDKVFPNSQWEFWKPTKQDIWGFALCWVGVLIVIAIYIGVMRIGT
jgi:solute:Na+ symporter, SSS family